MCREAAQIETMAKGALFESLQVRVRFLLHLDVQDLNRVETGFGRQVDAFFDGEFCRTISPIGIRGDGDPIAARVRCFCFPLAHSAGRGGETGRSRCCGRCEE